MESDSAAAARRAVESVFDGFDDSTLRQLEHVGHTDFEHVFSFVAESPGGRGPASVPGRHAVASGPIRWVEVVPSPTDRQPVELSVVEVRGAEPPSDTEGSLGTDDVLTGRVHCWHG